MVLVADLVARVTADTAQASRGILSFGQNLVSMAGNAGLAVFGITQLAGAVAGTVTGFLGGAAEMERYQTQLTTLMGSADLAKDRLEELARFGASTPFELPELVRAEKVMQGFGLTGQKAFQMTGMAYEDFFTRVGDISAGVGRPFEEVALTFAKFSSGATGEAISRLQELGIATREQMASLGVEFSKSGELLSPIPVAMQAIMQLTESKFAGGMDKLSQTFEGRMSTLQDAWGGLLRTIGTPLLAFAGPAVQGLSDFIGGPVTAMAEKLGPMFQEGADQVKGTLAALGPYIQIGRDAIQTFQEAMAGEWVSAEGINPLVNSIGIFATSLRDDVIPAWNDFTAWFAGDGGSNVQAFSDTISSLAATVLPMLGQGIRTAIEQAGPFAALLINNIRPSMEAVGGFVTGTLVPGLQQLAAIVGPIVTTAVTQMGDAFMNIGTELSQMGPEFMALGEAVAPLVPILGGVAAIVGGVLLAGFASAWATLSGLLSGIPTVIRGIVVGLTDVISGFLSVVDNWVSFTQAIIRGDWTGAWAAAGGVVQGFGTMFQGVITGLMGIVTGVFGGIIAAVLNNLAQLTPGARDELMKMKNVIITSIQSIDLRTMAQAMIRGMIDGIASQFPAVTAVLGTLRGLFPSSPAKWGPWSKLPEWSSAFESLPEALHEAGSAMREGLTILEHDAQDGMSGINGAIQAAQITSSDAINSAEIPQSLQAFIDSLGPKLAELTNAIDRAAGPGEAPAIQQASTPVTGEDPGDQGSGSSRNGLKEKVKTLMLTVPIEFHNTRFGLGPENNLTPRDIDILVEALLPRLAVEVAKLIDDEDQE